MTRSDVWDAVEEAGTTRDVEWMPLSPRALSMWRLLAVLGLGAPGLIAIASAGVGGAVAMGATALAVVAAVAVALQVVTRRHAAWGYATRDQDLLIRRGVLVKRLSVVPYGRMQFVDVSQGPVERRFDLSSVVLHTAAATSDAAIPGLTTADAGRLRDRLAELGEAHAAGL